MQMCKEIPLTKGQVALVDSDDYDRVSQWKWHAHWDGSGNRFYAQRSAREGKHSKSFSMHRVILGLGYGDCRQVDHINLNGLDNRRENLRIVSAAQNRQNRPIARNNTTGFKGVCAAGNRYRAQISVGGKRIRLGYRLTAESAWRELYLPAAVKYHGEYARVE